MHRGRAVLAAAGLRDLAAELLRDHLEAVADAEHRNAELEDGRVERRRAHLVDDWTGRRLSTIPTGFFSAISAAVTVCGTISL